MLREQDDLANVGSIMRHLAIDRFDDRMALASNPYRLTEIFGPE